MRKKNNTYWQVWRIPILLGLLSLLGLLLALVGNQLWDAVSWLLLGIPLLVIGWFSGRAGKHSR